MTSSWSVRQVVDRILALELVNESAAARLNLPDLDRPLGEWGSVARSVVHVLSQLGIVYSAHFLASFYGLEDGSDEERLAVYRRELAAAADVTRGQMIVTDVQLVDVARGQLLRFRCNGEPVEWPVQRGPGENLAALDTFTRLVDLLPASSPKRWFRYKGPYEAGDGAIYIFAAPAALAELARTFGLRLDPDPGGAPSGADTAPSSALV